MIGESRSTRDCNGELDLDDARVAGGGLPRDPPGRGAAMIGPAITLLALLPLQAALRPDTVHAPTPPPAPAPHLDRHDRTDVLLGATLLGTLAAVHLEGPNEVDDLFGPQPAGADHLVRRLPRTLGRFEAASGLAGGLYLLGGVTHHPELHRAGLRALESLAISSVGTTALKLAVGRARPGDGREEDTFHPFRLSSASWSFPSGHTSAVFAVAGALSAELGRDHPWVPFVAYPTAAWVGVGRVVDGRHWATDVLAGAVVGVLSARLADSWFGNPGGNDGAVSGAASGAASAAADGPFRLSPTAIETPDGHLMPGVRLTFR
jgi:membrane-associated phospholipid phosphatase